MKQAKRRRRSSATTWCRHRWSMKPAAWWARLTIDEVVDVIREEGEDAALAQAGLREEEDLFASVWNSARNRWLWLAVNLVHRLFRVARDRGV